MEGKVAVRKLLPTFFEWVTVASYRHKCLRRGFGMSPHGKYALARVDQAKSENRVTAYIRFRNHIYSTLVEELIYTGAHVRS